MVDDRSRKFRKMLAEAPNYEVWKAAALELDFLEGNVEWKEEFGSDLYHYELIYDRLSNLVRQFLSSPTPIKEFSEMLQTHR